ncbi:hypothetical protein HER10_EVM0011676 [Colletotrichum scovillei]|uniref:uncharacterized protein n=1 Tax=Colletotrichum scovillei TaxID=1209932 RepID=UPI0015C3B2BF|nr:uncharacterized protein HER10_EVM0011676 [Colletotrichum scovillei]KAF4774324.1 hypothetical protein HER10_EVM0011676 [Colletotrichum scovillei]
MAATVPGGTTLGVPGQTKQKFNKVLGLQPEQNEKELYAIFRADSTSRFYVPAVMMGHNSTPPPSSRTVHVLGNDERSLFLSHALHGIYDSVKTLDIPANTPYRGIAGNLGTRKNPKGWIEPNAALETSPEVEKDDTHISNLVVSGRPSESIKLLEKVKHRIDDRTAVCYVQDGLGVAEAATNRVFPEKDKRPSIMLGHMTHSLAFDRKAKSVKVMTPKYETALAGVRPYYGPKKSRSRRSCSRPSAILSASCWITATMSSSTIRRSPMWSRACPKSRTRLSCRAFCGEGMRKEIMENLEGRGPRRARWRCRYNGAWAVGVKLPANEMVVGMVKAKHKAQVEKNRSYMPLELTSRR